MLAVKGNRKSLYGRIDALFERALDGDFAGMDHEIIVTETKGRGRREKRTYLVIHEPEGLPTAAEWEGLKAVVMVTRERAAGEKESMEHG